ncbi:MAG: hypothetical protein AB8B49_05285, partial [Nitratireductor sp.]
LAQTPTNSASHQADMPLSWHLEQGFKLSHHFLERHCYVPRGIQPPQERDGLIKRILKAV